MGLLDSLKKTLTDLAREHAPIDPAVFDDPVAGWTDWTPLVPGGSNFRTHGLVELDADRLAMKKSVGMYLFGGIFLLVGLAATIAVLAKTGDGAWPFALFGLVFVGVGAYLVWPTSTVFDGRTRQFELKGAMVTFDTVHALQILKERVSGDKSSYWSYELNFIFRDGTRKNLVDHGNLERLRGDAEKLRAFLGCKLWDATAVH